MIKKKLLNYIIICYYKDTQYTHIIKMDQTVHKTVYCIYLRNYTVSNNRNQVVNL